MPNHVTNVLTIESGHEEFIMDFIKGNDEFIDFNTIHPMPDDLRNTTSPTRIVTPEEFAKQMPETFGKGITEQMSKIFKMKYGADNWYDWATRHWSTKWNAYDTCITDEGDIQFSTAWSTPVSIIEKLSILFPDDVFKVKFADEDIGYNCGEYTYQNGVMIEAYEPEFGSDEAIKFAKELQGLNYEEI